MTIYIVIRWLVLCLQLLTTHLLHGDISAKQGFYSAMESSEITLPESTFCGYLLNEEVNGFFLKQGINGSMWHSSLTKHIIGPGQDLLLGKTKSSPHRQGYTCRLT